MKTITISENLFSRLEREAHQHGFRTIEQLLESQHTLDISPEELLRRQEAISRVEELQKRFSAKYGMMPDSAELVREDRER